MEDQFLVNLMYSSIIIIIIGIILVLFPITFVFGIPMIISGFITLILSGVIMCVLNL